jgi:hypothetical protein
MADLARLLTLTDDALGDALRGLGAELDVPPVSVSDAADPARLARLRIEAAAARPPAATAGFLERLGVGRGRRTWRRSLVLAVAALLVLAAVAGAIGFGLPGLRIVFTPAAAPTPGGSPAPSTLGASSGQSAAAPSPTPSSSEPPGSGLGLGTPTTLAAAQAQAGFPILLPGDPAVGPPDAVWIDDVGRVTLIWRAGAGLPATEESSLGLLVSEFPGTINPGYFEKLLDAGSTIDPITVRGRPGYWISGEPHEFVYVNPSNQPTFDARRLVGDTLAWSDGPVTYRIESALGREAAIRIAESLAPAP